MLHEKDQLWRQILFIKYGSGQRSSPSIWWKDLNDMCVGSTAGFWFENCLNRRIGEGDDTLFWKDDWLGMGKFKDKFPALFALSDQRDKKVFDMGGWGDNGWVWRFDWSGILQGESQSQFEALNRIIASFTPVRGKRDAWVWVKESDGNFTVSSAYEAIFVHHPELEEDAFKCLWKVSAPSNAIALGWRVLLDRIASKTNLQRRNVLVGEVFCSLCSTAAESTFHLFFSCSCSSQVWTLVLQWLGFNFVCPGSPLDHFNQFVGSMCCTNKNGLALVWLAVILQIWNGRNGAIFRGVSFEPATVFDLIQNKSWEWLRAKNRRFIHAYSEWFLEPLVCLSDM